ncbi:hypothetical protein [Micromonospora sp. WMMD708]|uniref:hypothetical protein n=1 Tax=Micromonospora sp. WMMD708 TaxID=3403464 RepID=UPI003BF53030
MSFYFMMKLRVSVPAKVSPRLPFLTSKPYYLNPFRPAVRSCATYLLAKINSRRKGCRPVEYCKKALIRKLSFWRESSSGPSAAAVWLNLSRFLRLGSIGAFFAAAALGVPYAIGFGFLRLAAGADQQGYVRDMAVSLIAATAIVAAIFGFSLAISGASKIATSPYSRELRRISKSSGRISSESFLESSISIYSYSLLGSSPIYFTYIFFTSLVSIISTNGESLKKTNDDLFGGSPLLASGCIVGAGVVAYFLVILAKVRDVKRQMEPTRALMALLDETSRRGEGRGPYGKYSPIPDPLGDSRYGLAALAQQMHSSAVAVAPELRQMSAPHPLSRVLDGLGTAIRRILVKPDPPDSARVKEMRGVLELVAICLAEPRDPGLLSAAGMAVGELARESAEEDPPAPSRKSWSITRLVAVLDLVDGPTKAVNAVAAMGAVALAFYAAVNGGDFSGLTKLLFK